MAKRLKWRLDTVKRVKEREVDSCQEALAIAQEKLRKEQEVKAELETERERQHERLRGGGSGKLNPGDLQASHAFLQNLAERIKSQNEKIGEATEGVEAARTALVEASKETKILDNLRDRDHQTYKRDVRKRDQAQLDETAGRRAFEQKREDPES